MLRETAIAGTLDFRTLVVANAYCCAGRACISRLQVRILRLLLGGAGGYLLRWDCILGRLGQIDWALHRLHPTGGSGMQWTVLGPLSRMLYGWRCKVSGNCHRSTARSPGLARSGRSLSVCVVSDSSLGAAFLLFFVLVARPLRVV